MTSGSPFAVRCTLTFGDIYGQVLAWMAVIFVSLAAGLALMGSSRPVFALVGVGLILVLSLPFLLFAFVTTLLNHIQLNPVEGCLLYTSPSPRDGLLSRMPSSA